MTIYGRREDKGYYQPCVLHCPDCDSEIDLDGRCKGCELRVSWWTFGSDDGISVAAKAILDGWPSTYSLGQQKRYKAGRNGEGSVRD